MDYQKSTFDLVIEGRNVANASAPAVTFPTPAPLPEKESAESLALAHDTPERPRTAEELKALQVRARAEGHCGSLQTSSGLPCMRYPKPGYTVCRKHGERAPATVAKAERLLAVARMPAIEWILTAIDQANETMCHTCGFPRHGLKERKRIDSLTFKLLDRTGFGPRQTIDLNAKTTDTGVDVSNFNAEELERLDVVLRAMDDLQASVQRRCAREAAEKVIEGVVVKQLE